MEKMHFTVLTLGPYVKYNALSNYFEQTKHTEQQNMLFLTQVNPYRGVAV